METDAKKLFLYWIQERYNVYLKKTSGAPRPWSDDPVFQTTYFCNVHRENDKITQWIREYYSPFVGQPMFEFNILLSRFLNYPPTLKEVGYLPEYTNHSEEPNTPGDAQRLEKKLDSLAERGRVWGNAYVITTHGIPMPKARYLCQNVLVAARNAVEAVKTAVATGSCATTARVLERIEGVGSFLSGQIVADLKNTEGHPLREAVDWMTFANPGPGSLRGASWFFTGESTGVTPTTFPEALQKIREYVDNAALIVPPICNQDLQNCLCEFDKFMRVRTGQGRSKRKYPGV